MEKTGQKTYKDPTLNKIVQEKAAWNRSVSALINDLIHFKKSVNGWPSKYYKERTRITAPIPVDLAGILSQIAGEFQEITNRGNSILAEQAEFSKSHMKRKTDQTLSKLDQMRGPTDVPKPTAPGGTPDLSKQLSPGVTASKRVALLKLAIELEDKYSLESQASNPITRFVTRLFNPKYGFGEAARMRRLRMTMLDSCAKAYKALKALHKEVVKSSKGSVENSHKMMTSVWNHWNIVNRIFNSYKALKPGDVKDPGGKIEDPEAMKQRVIEEGNDPDEVEQPPVAGVQNLVQDYQVNSNYIGSVSKNPQFRAFVSMMERLKALPKNRKPTSKELDELQAAYNFTISATNLELGTSGSSFQDIVKQHQSMPKKEAQFLGKIRHQLIPGATSGSRLELYNLINTLRQDLDKVMDLLEEGFDQEKLSVAISQVNRQMTALRTMTRALYFSEKPEMAPSAFF